MAWTQVVHRPVARLSPVEIGAMQSAVLERARSVARASGSEASHISSAEAAALHTLAPSRPPEPEPLAFLPRSAYPVAVSQR
jgi:hypothetical protein